MKFENDKVNASMFRQGDVLVRRVSADPTTEVGALLKGAKAVDPDAGRTILAYGEVTGHAHALPATTTKLFEGQDGMRMMVVQETTNLTHEEHDTITLEPGIYEVIRQTEYTMFGRRTVAD